MRGERSQRLRSKRQLWGQGTKSDLVLVIQPGLQQLLGQRSDVTRTCEMPPGFFSLGMSRKRQGQQGLNKEMQSREVMRHSEESFMPALNNL